MERPELKKFPAPPLVLISLLFSWPLQAGEGKGGGISLRPEEKRVVGLLFEDWDKRFRSTNIEQAMARAKVPFSHARRMRIASYLVADQQAKEKMRWQPAVYILTNNEKRMARVILRSAAGSGAVPSARDLARAIGMREKEAEEGLDALTWLGFLERKDKRNYALAEDHKRFLSGLGFNFHEVVLESGERFNIN